MLREPSRYGGGHHSLAQASHMSATVVPLPPNSSSETVDFLRRMASMVSGRNGEMLLRAASLIESLTQRAMSAERLYHEQQNESTRNAELREAAELASDAMVGQIDVLRAQLAESRAMHAELMDGIHAVAHSADKTARSTDDIASGQSVLRTREVTA